MPFTVDDFRDLIRLLEERPEWREELRRLLLTQEVLELPALVRQIGEQISQLTEAQRRTEQRVEELAEAQRRTEQRLHRLERVVEELAQAQRRTEEILQSLIRDVGTFKGISMEWRYRERPYAYFGSLIRRARTLPDPEWAKIVERGEEEGVLTQEEAEELRWVNAVIHGRSREDGQEVYLVVEMSWGIGIEDVQRASKRANLLARLGLRAKPVVAGAYIRPEAREWAQSLGVLEVLDGRILA